MKISLQKITYYSEMLYAGKPEPIVHYNSGETL